MTRILLLAAVVIFTTFPSSGRQVDVPMRGYSTETMSDPIYSPAETAVKAASYMNWLASNVDNISPERLPGYREHLYELINSQVSAIYSQKNRVMPSSDDLLLASLFMWSERLGVYGGSLVHERVKPKGMASVSNTLAIPGDFELTLQNDMFHLATKKQGWRVKFPYFFMLHDIRAITTNDGHQAAILILSTGTAWHTSRAGKSQATLMLIISPDATPERFTQFWHKAVGLDTALERTMDSRHVHRSRYAIDAQYGPDKNKKLHKEFVSWTAPQAVFGLFYSGLDGTYQFNRQHFADFLNAIRPY